MVRRLTLLPLVLTLAGCGGGGAAPANQVVVALRNAPTHLDPRVGTDQSSARVFDLMLNGLVTKAPNGDLVPDLATSWEVLDDGLRYRFHLRPGVQFHDGRELTADDVVWTFGSIVDGTVVSPKAGAFSHVERVEAADPLTVDFVLRRPFGAMLADLTSFVGIVPAGVGPEEFESSPVGSGPFRLVERTPDAISFAAWDGYWEGRPRLDRVVLRAVPDATVRALELEKGSVHLVISDLTPDVVQRFRDDPRFRVQADPGSVYTYLGFNMDDELVGDVRVRRALALALDRQKLADSLWRGLALVTETALPPGHWARNDDLEAVLHDPAAARRLLDDAGYPDPDGDGPRPRFTISYKTSTDEVFRLQAQAIQAMAAEAGIGIEIRSYEFATFYADIKAGNFQMFSLNWTGVVDPNIYKLILHSDSIPPDGANRGRYRNPEFDRLVDLGARFLEPAKRRPYYLEAQQILARDLPYISLFNRLNYAVLPQALEGYRNYTSGELYSLRQAHWAAAPGG
jgi:peptide/nickel transport system substrate-binding protein